MAPLARTADPATSQAAADAVPLSHLQQLTLAAVRSYYCQRFTALEVASTAQSLSGGMVESYRKRVRELCRLGWITQSGQKRCSITGQNCIAFVEVRR